MENYQIREVTQFINEFGDEVELGILQNNQHFLVTATICSDLPPFKDYIGAGDDCLNQKRAMEKALRELYKQAYPQIFHDNPPEEN